MSTNYASTTYIHRYMRVHACTHLVIFFLEPYIIYTVYTSQSQACERELRVQTFEIDVVRNLTYTGLERHDAHGDLLSRLRWKQVLSVIFRDILRGPMHGASRAAHFREYELTTRMNQIVIDDRFVYRHCCSASLPNRHGRYETPVC